MIGLYLWILVIVIIFICKTGWLGFFFLLFCFVGGMAIAYFKDN